ncbi:SGNH/GDSL hydrolase family protein [Nakamurella lactea]|uniref:SGNH/GDSL hydrolase family protein n=1 Tax=Nakamurella lactea TaxID=459515 RepID=UPI0003FE198D|nr:SGNH/GDSL hydrolase family protein [Nakamurella lactea]
MARSDDHPHNGLGATAVTAAATVGVALVGLGGIGWAAMSGQARDAARRIEDAAIDAAVASGAIPPGRTLAAGDIRPPDGDGLYPPARTAMPRAENPGPAPAGDATAGLTLTMLGDSTSVGFGTDRADQLPGVLLARRLATEFAVPVRLSTHGRVGAASAELADQVTAALAERPDLAVIVIGANDITERVPPGRAARLLGAAVAGLRAERVQVVVATCPDFGVIAPIPQPLRTLVTRWSQRLAALQDRAVRAADGVPIAIGRLVSPEFRGRPDLFYADGFHPSASGYARAVDVMTPEVIEAARRALDARATG